MSKITIKDLYLIFGNDKQHALHVHKPLQKSQYQSASTLSSLHL